ncbi:MAG: hypothetical protein D6692_04495, partial [Planctomycetota bacterium]
MMSSALSTIVLAIASTQPSVPTWDGSLPNRDDAAAVVAFVVGGPRDDQWVAGLQEATEWVRANPARYAPAVRDLLMQLPPGLDEYRVDDTHWSVGGVSDSWPYPTYMSIMPVVELLGREHAEPILREFAGAVLPLALEAKRRYADVEARWRPAWVAAGKPVGDARFEHAELVPLLREKEETGAAVRWLTSAWVRSVSTARRLGSPIFVDDSLTMLSDPDPIVRAWGAWMAGYVLQFAEERPDAVAALRAAAERLEASDVDSDQKAAAAIRDAFDPKPTPGLP